MKYIRTIIDTIEMLVCEDADGTIITEKYNELGIKITNKMKSSWIKKQSDNIAELCDKWIVVIDGTPHVMAHECDVIDKIENNKKLGINTVAYGAVWVQLSNGAWRLEPVTEIKEGRELELL